jgi:AcrR family transcriptional regulator
MTSKKDQLIEAAIDLFAREGFWNTPTTAIAKYAKVSTGTLFHYFPTKDALIDGVYVQLKNEISAHLRQGYPETEKVRTRLAHICRRYVQWGIHNPSRFSLLEQLRLSSMVSVTARATEENRFIYQVLEECFREGFFVDLPPDYALMVIVTQMDSATKYAIVQSFQGEPLTRHIEQSFEICWRGLSE